MRAKLRGLKRNAAVALGNAGTADGGEEGEHGEGAHRALLRVATKSRLTFEGTRAIWTS
jgi:hypothetical protein